jgi:hypothetical protein
MQEVVERSREDPVGGSQLGHGVDGCETARATYASPGDFTDERPLACESRVVQGAGGALSNRARGHDLAAQHERGDDRGEQSLGEG